MNFFHYFKINNGLLFLIYFFSVHVFAMERDSLSTNSPEQVNMQDSHNSRGKVLYDGTKVFYSSFKERTEYLKERSRCIALNLWMPCYTGIYSGVCWWGLKHVSLGGGCSCGTGIAVGTGCCLLLCIYRIVGGIACESVKCCDGERRYVPGNFRECTFEMPSCVGELGYFSCVFDKDFYGWPNTKSWQPLTKKNIRRLLKQLDNNNEATAFFKERCLAKKLIKVLDSKLHSKDITTLVISYVLEKPISADELRKSFNNNDKITNLEVEINKILGINPLFLDKEYLHSLLDTQEELPESKITKFYSSILWLERCGWVSLKKNEEYCMRIQSNYFDLEALGKEIGQDNAEKYAAAKSRLHFYLPRSGQLEKVYNFKQDPYYNQMPNQVYMQDNSASDNAHSNI